MLTPEDEKFLTLAYNNLCHRTKRYDEEVAMTKDEWIGWWTKCPLLQAKLDSGSKIRTSRIDRKKPWAVDNLQALETVRRKTYIPRPKRHKKPMVQTRRSHFTPWYDSSRILSRNEWLEEVRAK